MLGRNRLAAESGAPKNRTREAVRSASPLVFRSRFYCLAASFWAAMEPAAPSLSESFTLAHRARA